MIRSDFPIAVLVLTISLLGAGLAGMAAAQDSQAVETTERLLLLKNGNVLSGQVTLVGEQYRLVNPGSEVRLRTMDVVQIAGSLAELYEWRRGSLGNPTLDDHLQLADWCTQQQLFAEAARELLDARALDRRSPRVTIAERRLNQAWRNAVEREARETKAQLDPAGSIDTQIAQREMADSARDAEQSRLSQTLPDGALEHFTRRVQPILVNNCTTSGCHRPGSDHTFQLSRSLLHGQSDRRSTFKNLASVLAAIDRQHVEASPLLRAGSGPHAGQAVGLLTGRRQELQDEVTAWARSIADPASATTPPDPKPVAHHAAGFASMVGGGFQQAPPPYQALEPPVASEAKQYAVAPAAYQEEVRPSAAMGAPQSFPLPGPEAKEKEVEGASFEETYQPLPPGRILRGAKNAQRPPRDEFDPEIFNRLHR